MEERTAPRGVFALTSLALGLAAFTLAIAWYWKESLVLFVTLYLFAGGVKR